MSQKTVFIDRDGVINRRLIGDWVKHWEEFDLLDGVPQALALLKASNFRLVLITNQRAIALNLLDFDRVNQLHSHMNEDIVSKGGAAFDAIYICPHDRHENCECRKPQPGMFLQAAEDFPDINLPSCVMFGDSDSDGEAAIAAGCARFYKIDEKSTLLDLVQDFIGQENP
ncbi:MAG: HAD-IIIA family hydrolase [Lentisphaeraceae bacterium]|nr:HAD-IIIA family hydrolase [Lentisphaeraceae bacterium]